MHVTIANGAARLGNFTLGTDQPMDGHLLVVQGDADVYGHLQGNLVTVAGTVFADTNGNGRLDFGERGLANHTIEFMSVGGDEDELVATAWIRTTLGDLIRD